MSEQRSYREAMKPIADDYLRVVTQERTAYLTTLETSLKNRIELVRDYTVFSTALLAAVVTIFATNNSINANTSLLTAAGLLSLVTVMCCIVSRQYYIDEGDISTLNIEKKFAYETSIVQIMKFADNQKDFEAKKSELEKPEMSQVKKFIFFKNDIKNIGYLIALNSVLLIFSLFICNG